jgi:hypothetical protein
MVCPAIIYFFNQIFVQLSLSERHWLSFPALRSQLQLINLDYVKLQEGAIHKNYMESPLYLSRHCNR